MRIILLSFVLWYARKASGFSPFEAKSMMADLVISSGVEFSSSVSPRELPDVSSVMATLTSFPRDSFHQKVERLDITGNPKPEGITQDQFNNLQLQWTSLAENYCNFLLTASVRTNSEIIPVQQRIAFPMLKEILPEDVAEEYLKFTEIANRNQQIEDLAQEILSSLPQANDLYHVVVGLADWVNTNIKYDKRAMMFPKESLKCRSAASVLESGFGKCDEISALFISFNRILGIPARFVTGQAYTNIPLYYGEGNDEEAKNWGAHAWAEIYFPGVGWIPFDVTYGEFGYLSAGHVQLHTSNDAADNTNVRYHAQGYDFVIKPKVIDIAVKEGQTFSHCTSDPSNKKDIEFSLEPIEEQVMAGQIVELICTIKNPNDYYVCSRIDLANTQDARLLNECPKHVLLNPKEIKEFLYRYQVSESLENGFVYKFPFSISSGAKEARTMVLVKDQISEKRERKQVGQDVAMQWGIPAMNREVAPPQYKSRGSRSPYEDYTYDPRQGPRAGRSIGNKVHNPGDWTRENEQTMFQKGQPRQPSPEEWQKSNGNNAQETKYWDQIIDVDQGPQQQERQGESYSAYDRRQARDDYSTSTSSGNEGNWHENWKERLSSESSDSDSSDWWSKEKKQGANVHDFESAAEYRKGTDVSPPSTSGAKQDTVWSVQPKGMGRYDNTNRYSSTDKNQGTYDRNAVTNKYHDQTGQYQSDSSNVYGNIPSQSDGGGWRGDRDVAIGGFQRNGMMGRNNQRNYGTRDYHDQTGPYSSTNEGQYGSSRSNDGWQRNDLMGRSKQRYEQQRGNYGPREYYDQRGLYGNNQGQYGSSRRYFDDRIQQQQGGRYNDSNRYPSNGGWQSNGGWRDDRDVRNNGSGWQRNDLLGRSKERYNRGRMPPPPSDPFGYDPYGPPSYYGGGQWGYMASLQPKKEWWDKEAS